MTKELPNASVGSGTYGIIEKQSLVSKEFVTKVLFVDVCVQSIIDAIQEVAIGKLCSALGIGPAFETGIEFDVVVYQNAIQFHLELCVPYYLRQSEYGRFRSDMTDNLVALHFFQIIHKDIKPANIVWSVQFGRFVFCDFGLSHYVAQ